MDGGRRVTPTQQQPAPQPPAGAAWDISDTDVYLFNEGTHRELAGKLGAHFLGSAGTAFAVWAPSARSVSVIGDFNRWDRAAHPLDPLASSGIWVGVIPDAAPGHVYKYALTTADGAVHDKADPYAFAAECPPRTGSVVWDLAYDWGDGEWMANRDRTGARDAPVSIYEVHLGSWRRPSDDPTAFLSYEELAPLLIDHVLRTGFTHVEFLPVMEHPFYGSWGYQTTGYFAPTARYGTPQDLMYLIDVLHQHGIGVLVQVGPVEVAQGEGVGGEMRGHPVEEDPDTGLMQLVDQGHEALGRPVTRGGREVAGGLVAPAPIEGVFHHGEEFHVGETGPVDVIDEQGGQLLVAEEPGGVVGRPPPRTEVDLVD